MSTGIDLHLHSSSSDGTQSPRELLLTAAAAGLHTIALTDHDTIDGWTEAQATADELGLNLILGAEVSIELNGIGLHLLAYGFDPTHAGLREAMQTTRTSRQGRAQLMVQRLSEDFPITWESVLAQAEPDATIGRPHIADALVAAGVVPHRDDAFATMLHARTPYYVPYPSAEGLATIPMVREAGGVAVLAHPWANHRGRKPGIPELELMVSAGLQGWEVDHPDHDAETRQKLADLATQWDVLQLGSSDYHGTGKSTPIGACTTQPGQWERLRASLA